VGWDDGLRGLHLGACGQNGVERAKGGGQGDEGNTIHADKLGYVSHFVDAMLTK
jgi:hypothetical protein